MPLLFEYHEWKRIENGQALKNLLCNIWQQRKGEFVTEVEGADSRYQPFLQFDGNEIRANNYVGFIQNNNELIEIYPKVFRNLPTCDSKIMLEHIFYWFTYCRKWRFPFTQASLDCREIDKFPELIIHLIAKQFFEIVSQNPLMQYQGVEEALVTPRGSINFNRYVTNSLSRGNFHLLECDYEPFLFDNKVNRIIKYCCRLLLSQTRFAENQHLLQQTLFVLDEVTDVPCTSADLNSVSVNAFYEEYSLLMEMCKAVIENKIYNSDAYDSSQWCILFSMEYVFEDFVAGFLQKHFSEKWKVEYQKSNMYLSTVPEVFNLQHDVFLTEKEGKRKIIVDTKYKLRSSDFKSDPKKGVAQDDLYQVLAYAYKQGCTEVFLIYPNISEKLNDCDEFYINSGFGNNTSIKVTAVEIPFWSINDFKTLDKKLMLQMERILEL